jgi:hypothetical protein
VGKCPPLIRGNFCIDLSVMVGLNQIMVLDGTMALHENQKNLILAEGLKKIMNVNA